MRITLTIAVALAMIACTVAFAQDAEAPAEAAEEAAAEQPQAAQDGERVQDELIALYRFDKMIEGTIIPDVTREFGGLDLMIQGAYQGSPVEVRDGAVHLSGVQETQVPGVFSTDPATDIVNSMQASGQLTVEAWVTPAADDLTGPARIVTISHDTAQRNITLGQHRDAYALRMRTSATNGQGNPEVHTPEGSLKVNELQHVVVTFDGQTTVIYVDGESVYEAVDRAGTFENWDDAMHLGIGNEITGDRRWFGSVHLVAFYTYALSPDQVRMNFDAGV
ncbi:MAG: LamG domain-containing protein [Armatimonadota bacterium]